MSSLPITPLTPLMPSSLSTSLPVQLPKANTLQRSLVLNNGDRDMAWQRQRIDETAEAFESQFLSLMIGNMFTDIDSDGLFGGGQGEEMYRSFVVDEYGKAMAAEGGIGLADSVRTELLRLQEIPAEEGTELAPKGDKNA